jgi:SAM-dependent methyltransferase
MNYLLNQYAEVMKAVERGDNLRDVLAIKWYVQELMTEHITRYLSTGSSVLEVGCGGSLTLHFLSRQGQSVVGVDRDRRFIHYSRALRNILSSRAALIQGEALRLPFPAASFDYVYSVGMLEHFDISTQRLIVAEMCRVSRQYIHLEIPNAHPLSTFYAVGQQSAEVHLPCNPGMLLADAHCTVVEVDGRCVFDTLDNLKQNPSLLTFASAQAPALLREVYTAADVSRLCEAERKVSKPERLVYGFQLAWVAMVPTSSDDTSIRG